MGAGTTGFVFRAHDPVEGRLVAIKAFRLDLTPERAAALADALQALAGRGLSHPSIAGAIGAGVEDGIAWFAQAYVPAESLDSALRQYGPPPVADALTIVTQLAGALDFAAAAGVLHGSLHPRDVLVAPGETHLVDLGVATALEACGVRAPVRRPYNAPERAGGHPISRAGDVFALAAIAFELLSGQPVTGAGDDGIVTLPDLPGANREALLETFSFALALPPDERYATALAFAAPLKKALGDALTRPAAPRKRRTTRPPEALLPIAGLDAEPLADATRVVEPVGPSFAHDVPASVEPGSASLPDADPPFAPARVDVDEPPALAATTYLPDPPEPEPYAPAVERIADPGDSLRPVEPDIPYASLDDIGVLSPLDAAELHAPPHVATGWEGGGDGTPDDARVPLDRPPGGDDQRYTIAGHSEYAHRDRPDPIPDPDAVHVPPAVDYRGMDESFGEEPRGGPARSPWVALAAMLLVGLVAGLTVGWFLFGGRGAPSADATVAQATARPDAAETRPRDWTDDTVRQPDAAASRATTPAPTAAPRATSSPAETPARGAPPAAAAATRPPEAAIRGRIVVRTRPEGARVEIGGRNRGESPTTLSDLSLGEHTIRVSRQGYVTEQRRVTLSARQPAQTVDVTLRRPAPPAPSRTAREAPGGFVGTLVVESRPAGAKVFVDGRGVGVTPVTVPDVRVGSHVVRLEMTGYRRWSTPVRVVAGERERVAASLEEEAAR